jgi:hypothetical protein
VNSSALRISIGRARRGLGSLRPGPVYVGRPSSLANPYAPGRDGSRDGSGDGSGEPVIAQWRRWLLALLVRRCSWRRIVADGKPSSK